MINARGQPLRRRLAAAFTAAALAVVALPVAGHGAVATHGTVVPLDVPLLIQEALGDDPAEDGFQLLPGVDRDQEPVTFGLPLPEQANISHVEQLGLAGAEAAQFRALMRWPSGAIQWVLVDTLADVPAGGQVSTLRLIAGAGNFGGPNLASEHGETIWVDTGVAQFEIRKLGFNLLDAATVGGRALLSPGASPGIVLTGENGATFLAANDPEVRVSIEENGPVRAVILARGALYSAAAERGLDFTARLHFFKGKSRVRVFFTLRNASRHRVENVAFRSLELELASELNRPAFTVGSHVGPVSGALSSAGSALRLFQGENALPSIRDYDFECCWPTGISGYRIHRDGSLLASGSGDEPIDLLYAQASAGDGRAVTFGTRFGAGWWPQGLGIDADGVLRVGLFPASNDRPYYARYNGHVTRDVLLDFAAAAPDPRDAFFRFQYPLVGKARDADWYNRSGALWEKLVSFSEEAAYYAEHGWPVDDRGDATLNRRPEMTFVRHRYWGAGGGTNQYDFTKVDLHNFLREEAPYGGGYWLNAEQRLAYNADLATYHSDDFHAARACEEVAALCGLYGNVKQFLDLANAEQVPKAKAIFEGEHRHAYGMSLWYALSGDERFRETYLDWGEYMQTQEGWNGWERGLAWNIYNLVDLYRFSGEPAYLDLADQYMRTEVLERTAVLGVSPGTDWQRGFFVGQGDATSTERSMAPFIKGAMFPRAYAYFHDFAASSDLVADRVRDVLEGMVRFVSHELWFEYGEEAGSFGFPYRLSADSAPPLDVRTFEDWYGGMREAYPTFLYGYLLTGDAEFLRRGELLQKASAFNPGSAYWFQDLPDRQSLQHLLQNVDQYAVWRDLPISVEAAGSGAYTLSWTVPTDARRYWVKHAEKEIVPWLAFDRYARSYRFDPASYVPFFAAENVPEEPPPAAPGSIQGFTVSGLDPATDHHFAARYLADPPPAPTPTPLWVDDTSTSITFGGDWRVRTKPRAHGGSYRQTTQRGSFAVIRFSGTDFTWLTLRGPGCGKARVTVDGRKWQIVDLYAPTRQRQAAVVIGGLPSGPHRVRIMALGTRNSLARSAAVVFDAYGVR